MHALYPPIEPFRVRDLAVGGGHLLYVEECGRADGRPLLVLHGGPGSGCSPDHRRFFDPEHYRIILVDQRGSGRSVPRGGLVANRTSELVADLEQLRRTLGVDRWVLFGGSWGATLALVYAQNHPERVSALLLRSPFLARRVDLEWRFGDSGAARFFPEDWRDLSDCVGETQWERLIERYQEWVSGEDPGRSSAAARAWTNWGARLAGLASPESDESGGLDAEILARAQVETHFALQRYFLAENELLMRAGELPDCPSILVQGQRDLACPPEGAWSLHRAMPGSRLRLLPEAGHLAWEAGVVDALVDETDRLRGLPD
ncbi:prolyl aminopeptidase [Imhoffiella purpurea]|uniref:Proline iminopeptidase n=1 Tax=Imhoffiella purpurea TaxID=1249627 RepID=W9VSX9_9GAMM|nr:prolyl aminopeptidase [Imhoffiella purpurea]EXJ13475.1 Proline iminopeptidase [Imhoffiella purpurea]